MQSVVFMELTGSFFVQECSERIVSDEKVVERCSRISGKTDFLASILMSPLTLFSF